MTLPDFLGSEDGDEDGDTFNIDDHEVIKDRDFVRCQNCGKRATDGEKLKGTKCQ